MKLKITENMKKLCEYIDSVESSPKRLESGKEFYMK